MDCAFYFWVRVSLGVHGNGTEARRHVETKTYTCLPAAVFIRHSLFFGFNSEWKDKGSIALSP